MDGIILFPTRYGTTYRTWVRYQRAIYHVSSLDVYHTYRYGISTAYYQSAIHLGDTFAATTCNDVLIRVEHYARLHISRIKEEDENITSCKRSETKDNTRKRRSTKQCRQRETRN